MNELSSSCPCCASTDFKILRTIRASEAAQHFVLKEVDSSRFDQLKTHIASLWSSRLASLDSEAACNIVRCSCCGLSYSSPYVGGDGKFYNLAYSRNAHSYPQTKWEFQRTIQAMQAQQLANPVILEVGAGDGAFVRALQKLFPAADVLCTEFSDYAINKIRNSGIKCLNIDCRSLNLATYKEHFDYICLFQVVEHLDKLDKFFSHLYAMLKADGHVFIAVPNEKRILYNSTHGALLDMPPNHIGTWTRSAFEHIAARHGFIVDRHELEPMHIVREIKTFLIYRFSRSSQFSGSLANRIACIRAKVIRRSSQIIYMAIDGTLSIKGIFDCASPDLGMSQWVQLSKKDKTI